MIEPTVSEIRGDKAVLEASIRVRRKMCEGACHSCEKNFHDLIAVVIAATVQRSGVAHHREETPENE